MIYLSSRAIGQAGPTRSYVKRLKQKDGSSLPPGPVLMSPDRLLKSFTREIIFRRPNELKVKLLGDVCACFPFDSVPVWAGFGNRNTDVIAYREIGIPGSRIFTVDSRGAVHSSDPTSPRSDTSSYKKMAAEVNSVFPVYVDIETGVAYDDGGEPIVR